MVHDVTRSDTLESIGSTWINELRNNAGKDPAILMVGNKMDLLDDPDQDTSAMDTRMQELQVTILLCLPPC